MESIPCPLTSENEAILCSKWGSTQTPFTALVTVALWGRVASATNRHCYTEYKFQLLEKFTNFEFFVDFLIIIGNWTWDTIITSALTLPRTTRTQLSEVSSCYLKLHSLELLLICSELSANFLYVHCMWMSHHVLNFCFLFFILLTAITLKLITNSYNILQTRGK